MNIPHQNFINSLQLFTAVTNGYRISDEAKTQQIPIIMLSEAILQFSQSCHRVNRRLSIHDLLRPFFSTLHE
jgi:hypothetical protein